MTKEILEEEIIWPTTRFKTGQIIETGIDKWKVIEIKNDRQMVIEIVSCGEDKRGSIGSYVDIGKTYLMERYYPEEYMELWKIPSEQMKRNTSQILLYWFKDNDEPIIEMDF